MKNEEMTQNVLRELETDAISQQNPKDNEIKKQQKISEKTRKKIKELVAKINELEAMQDNQIKDYQEHQINIDSCYFTINSLIICENERNNN